MKISEKQKAEKKKKILDVAVDLIGESGFGNVSMRKIAKTAKVGEATIYNYFPNKDKIITFYFQERSERVIESLKKIKGWGKYSFQEQVQTMIYTHLDIYLMDREFVRSVFPRIFLSPAYYTGDVQLVKKTYTKIVKDIVEAAVDVGELTEYSASPIAYELMWDYFLGVVYYWIRDDSEEFINTTTLIDKSLPIIDSLMRSGIIDHAIEFISFLYRAHITPRMEFATRFAEGFPLKWDFFDREKEPGKKRKKARPGQNKKASTAKAKKKAKPKKSK